MPRRLCGSRAHALVCFPLSSCLACGRDFAHLSFGLCTKEFSSKKQRHSTLLQCQQSHTTYPPSPTCLNLFIEQDHKERTKNNQGGGESAIDLVAYVEFQRSLRCVCHLCLSSSHVLPHVVVVVVVVVVAMVVVMVVVVYVESQRSLGCAPLVGDMSAERPGACSSHSGGGARKVFIRHQLQHAQDQG